MHSQSSKNAQQTNTHTHTTVEYRTQTRLASNSDEAQYSEQWTHSTYHQSVQTQCHNTHLSTTTNRSQKSTTFMSRHHTANSISLSSEYGRFASLLIWLDSAKNN